VIEFASAAPDSETQCPWGWTWSGEVRLLLVLRGPGGPGAGLAESTGTDVAVNTSGLKSNSSTF
jgi:hypothetical protein